MSRSVKDWLHVGCWPATFDVQSWGPTPETATFGHADGEAICSKE